MGPLEPAIPTFVLRGHESSINSLTFLAKNAYLASGDSDGWLILWSLASKRAAAVWKAHVGGVSTIFAWGMEQLITHGRDHKLIVWQLPKDLATLSKTLPAASASGEVPRPWITHVMDMSALNFCSFAAAPGSSAQDQQQSLLIANPNGLDNGGVDIFSLPSQRRVLQIRSENTVNTGMVMSLALVCSETPDSMVLLAGYEDGRVGIYKLSRTETGLQSQRLSILNAHSQPVLSLVVAPDLKSFFTTSADAQIVQFSLIVDSSNISSNRQRSIDTKHSGQQGLSIRSDGKLFATAGWDSRIRVYSMKTMKELAVLKWHATGCFSTAFADLTVLSQLTDRQAAADETALDVIRQERSIKAQTTHWLAAGGKDGKISLWDIY
jgi:ASTRA-associated protein 1